MLSACQKRDTLSISSGLANFICAANSVAKPPTSRPPIALGCPVIENGPAPGMPIAPAAKWQLIMLLALSTLDDDWLIPME